MSAVIVYLCSTDKQSIAYIKYVPNNSLAPYEAHSTAEADGARDASDAS